MKKVHLSRYLKPYFSLAVIGTILLFAQANTELALPDYLSKIVNVGIQQEGIENSVPEAIRESQMKKVFLFMSAENKTKVLSAYSLENSSTADDKMLNRYPLLSNDSIFILKDQSKDTINLLNLAMAKALLIVFNIDNYIANASSPQLSMNMSIFANISSDMIYPLLESLPEQNRTLMLVQIENYLGKFPESYLIQGAVAPIKAEYVIIGMDVAQIQLIYILKVGGLMLILTILSVLCAFGVGWTSAKTASGFARDVRKDLFARVECFSNAEFDKFSTASLITRSTNDITQIQMLIILIFRMVFFAPTMALGATVRAINKALSMAWLIALAVIILICMIILLFSIVYPKFKMFQKLIDRVSLVAREGLTGMLVIRAFNREQFEMERFDDANKELTATALFTNRTMVFLFPVMTMIMNGLSLAIVWIGANEIANATLQVGDMIAFTQYAMHVVFSFLIISMVFIFFPRASVSGDRIAEVLSTELLIKDPVDQ